MFINEHYQGGNQKKKITWKDIQKMAKQMQKVPQLQKKSEEHHKKEALKADIEFEKNIKNI